MHWSDVPRLGWNVALCILAGLLALLIVVIILAVVAAIFVGCVVGILYLIDPNGERRTKSEEK